MSADLGLDRSGNGNDWAVTNMTYVDQMLDSPTNNFATWNAISKGKEMTGDATNAFTLSEGNLKATIGAESYPLSTIIPTSGKWYMESYMTSNSTHGPLPAWRNNEYTSTGGSGSHTGLWNAYFRETSAELYLYPDGVDDSSPTGSINLDSGDIIQWAWDIDAGKMWIGINNSTWYDSSKGTTGNPSTGANPTFTTTVAKASNFMSPSISEAAGGGVHTANFGQDSSFAGAATAQGNQDANSIGDFYYTPPTDFLALCTSNLPAVAVVPSDHFNTVLYSGNDADDRSIAVGFQPDFVWLKSRSNALNHYTYDVLRGANYQLLTNDDGGESNTADRMQAFESNGFQLGTSNEVNGSSRTYVSWNWKANGSGSSNTDGAINTTSTSANVDAGFSISTFTGDSSGTTVGHGLSKAPEIVITKGRSFVDPWHTQVYPSIVATKTLQLDDPAGETTSNAFNDTAPTASVFSISTGYASSGRTLVAYCFHSVDGFSKLGSYKGNGSSDGTFIYTGFRPAFVLIKARTTSEPWSIRDSARSPENVANEVLKPDNSAAELTTGFSVDLLSNGFKCKQGGAEINDGSHSYIYMAFAETPFKYSNAR